MGTDMGRPGRVELVGWALLTAAIMLGLPVLTWMLGVY